MHWRTRNAATDWLLFPADPDCGWRPDVSHSAEDDANGRNSPGSSGGDIRNRSHPLPPLASLDRTRVLALEAIIQLVKSGPGGCSGHDRGRVLNRVQVGVETEPSSFDFQRSRGNSADSPRNCAVPGTFVFALACRNGALH